MFSSKIQLQKRTPRNGTDRESFLSLLVDEYINSSSYDAKCQVLANLANFAYDPINYAYIREVGVLDIFLHVMKNETNETLLQFACAGICNLCSDPLNAEYILTQNGVKPIIALLNSNNQVAADALTSLIYLYNDQTKSEINTFETIQLIKTLKERKDSILANLANIFLEDICSTK
ncbi:armadillo repeat-containing protein 7-like [Achroia grisella]|uniref:armadillo repeat-containing protein 7-like n=1 Tax=Achroia grisella TaxID=688607 RepID=UPI0027D2C86C|nr:armadillo repeat-containing protein 7-like [Achroia grisella]